MNGVKPFLKWAGGKTQLLGELCPRIPSTFRHYHEPFVGGAALLLRIQPERATLSDSNPELVNCYRVVRDDVERLIEHLGVHRNEEEYFYEMRATDPCTLNDVERASRFIFLNRTCFNGLYRVNRRGQFNTPFGRYVNPRICDSENLRSVSRTLKSVDLLESDYSDALALAEADDFAYLDPPYLPVSQFSDFKRYTKEQFGVSEHVRLAEVFRELDARGCKVMLSNSDTPLVHELYEGFIIDIVQARRLINKNPEGRGMVNELVIRNYEH